MKIKQKLLTIGIICIMFLLNIMNVNAEEITHKTIIDCSKIETKTTLTTKDTDMDITGIGPGDSYIQSIVLQNNTDKDKKIKLESVKNIAEDDKLYNFLPNILSYEKENKVIFDGTLNNYIDNNDWVIVKANSNEELRISITFPSEAKNEYQNKDYNVAYTFRVEDVNKDPVPDKKPEITDKNVQTGIIRFTCVGAILGLCFSIICLLKLKKLEKEKENNRITIREQEEMLNRFIKDHEDDNNGREK